MLWTYVQATYGRTGIHSEDVRPYTLRTYGHTAQDVRPKNKDGGNRGAGPLNYRIPGVLRIAYWSRRKTSVGFIAFSEAIEKSDSKGKAAIM